jgi:hypothetical protein
MGQALPSWFIGLGVGALVLMVPGPLQRFKSMKLTAPDPPRQISSFTILCVRLISGLVELMDQNPFDPTLIGLEMLTFSFRALVNYFKSKKSKGKPT